jgi:antitoxin MazE
MKTRVQKWGNSLALRIPKSFAIEAGLRLDQPVELSLGDGRLVIQPLPQERLTLGELMRGVTKQNLHGEIR